MVSIICNPVPTPCGYSIHEHFPMTLHLDLGPTGHSAATRMTSPAHSMRRIQVRGHDREVLDKPREVACQLQGLTFGHTSLKTNISAENWWLGSMKVSFEIVPFQGRHWFIFLAG